MGVRIPGILASKKVAMVARVAMGPPGRTGVLHAVNAEHYPGERKGRPIMDLFPLPRVLLPLTRIPHLSPTICFLCYQLGACPYKMLRAVAESPAINVGIDSHSPSDLQVPALSWPPCCAPPYPTHNALILGVTSPMGFRYVSSIFLASVAAYSSRCLTSPALPGEPPGARCPSAAHKSPVSGASSAEPAHSRFWEDRDRIGFSQVVRMYEGIGQA